MSINDHALYLCSILLEPRFYSLICLQCRFWVNSADWVSKKDEYSNYWVLIHTFWIHLRFVKYRFVRYRFVKYWFRFVSRPWLEISPLSILFVFKTSSRHLFKTSLQDIPSRRLQGMSSRHLQRNNLSFSKTSWRLL